jgi:hypothetical protein
MNILIPVSPAELVDKIVILEIKEERIKDPLKLANVTHELELLRAELAKLSTSTELHALKADLKKANEIVWDSEEAVRGHWDDDRETLKQARISHAGNDKRFRLKRRINELLDSPLTEEKSHQN